MQKNAKQYIVGLGDIHVSKTPGEIIKTMALGSCVGVVMLAPKHRVVGMAHIVLPDSKIDPTRAETQPGYYADTGMVAIIDQFRRFNVINNHDLVVKLVGGASVLDANRTFDIGKRNVLASRKALWRNRMAAIAEDVGGNYSRTVWVEVDTGRVFVTSPGRGRWEL